MKSHRDLLVWQKAMTLVTGCDRITEGFPDRRPSGLSSQLRRAAVSPPSNIAEGNARRSKPASANHLSIAAGSLAEMETQIQIALNSGYVNAGDCEDVFGQIEEVRRRTAGLIRSLEASEQPRHFE